jgi:hypothetical protein
MPNGTDGEFVFGDPEGPFGLDQLHVPSPQRGSVNAGEIAAEQITGLTERGPIGLARLALPGDLQVLLVARRSEAADGYLQRSTGAPVATA